MVICDISKDMCVSLWGLGFGTLTENLARVLIKTLANGDQLISKGIYQFYMDSADIGVEGK